MSVLKFPEGQKVSGDLPFLSPDFPDLPNAVNPYQVNRETHPNIYIQFENVQRYIEANARGHEENLRLQREVNRLNAQVEFLNLELVKYKRLALWSSIAAIVAFLLRLYVH